MGLIPEIDVRDKEHDEGIFNIHDISESQLYHDFVNSYVSKGHTRTEAWTLVCSDLKRRNPKIYDDKFIQIMMQRAKDKDAQNSSQSK